MRGFLESSFPNNVSENEVSKERRINQRTVAPLGVAGGQARAPSLSYASPPGQWTQLLYPIVPAIKL